MTDEKKPCPYCDGEGRVPADGCGELAGGWADICHDCRGTGEAQEEEDDQ